MFDELHYHFTPYQTLVNETRYLFFCIIASLISWTYLTPRVSNLYLCVAETLAAQGLPYSYRIAIASTSLPKAKEKTLHCHKLPFYERSHYAFYRNNDVHGHYFVNESNHGRDTHALAHLFHYSYIMGIQFRRCVLHNHVIAQSGWWHRLLWCWNAISVFLTHGRFTFVTTHRWGMTLWHLI